MEVRSKISKFRDFCWVGSVLLPPVNEVCEGYVFTGVCLSAGGGGSCGLCPWGSVTETPAPVTVMCGRYASYWNAFLFWNFQSHHIIKQESIPVGCVAPAGTDHMCFNIH